MKKKNYIPYYYFFSNVSSKMYICSDWLSNFGTCNFWNFSQNANSHAIIIYWSFFPTSPSSKHLLFKQKRITIQSEGPSVAFAFSSTHPDIVRAELRPEIVPSICRSRNPNVIEFSRTSSQKTNDVSFHHLDFEAF